MTVTPRDELMDTLAELSTLEPRAGRDALVRARCHAVLTAPRRSAPSTRARARRLVDGALALAVGFYGVVLVVEVLRIIALLP